MSTPQKTLDKWEAYEEVRKNPLYTWEDLYEYQKKHEPEKLTPEEIEIYENLNKK